MLRHGTGVLQYHDLGFRPTLRDVITEMIITSDNTATDIVLMKIGGPAAVTKWLADSGYPQLSLARPAARLSPRPARAHQSGVLGAHAPRRPPG